MKKKLSKTKRKSLYFKIISLIVFCILVPIVLLSSISYYSLSNNIKRQFTEATDSKVSKISEIIKNADKVTKESVDMLSLDPNAKAFMANADAKVWFMKSLEGFAKTHKDVLSVYFGAENKKMLSTTAESLPAGYDPTARPWYKDAIANKGKIIRTEPYTDAGNDKMYVVTFAKTVEDASGKVVGVVGIDIALEAMSKSVGEITIGKEGFSNVIDKNLTVIAHKDKSKIGTTYKDNKEMQEVLEKDQEVFEKRIEGINYVIFKEKEELSGYTILGFIPKAELTSQISKEILVNIIVAIVSLIGAIFIGIKFVGSSIIKPIRKIVESLEKVQKGDFTDTVDKGKGLSYELEIIVDAINKFTEDISQVIRKIYRASDELKGNSGALLSVTEQSSAVGEEVAKAVQEIANGSVHQSEKLSDGAQVAEGLGEKVEESITNSNNMVNAAIEVKEATYKGTEVIGELRQSFEENYIANKEVAEKVRSLAEKSNEIEEITEVIKGITKQTNLLALNASIEAARAGEAGKGFAVVADEVKKLAEQSSESAAKIESVIGEVKRNIDDTMNQLKLSMELSDKTSSSMSVTNESFEKIERDIKKLEVNIGEVSNSLNEISTDKDIVIENISEAASVAQEAAASSEEVSASTEEQASALQEIASSAEKLDNLSEELKVLVSSFKVQ
ncbi:methyl-accepting chemotaxis protein [Clostridium brassicae]|uniref:Methyl-accepting chemotaxis protein n=1 Tax=Clostridium brassicae TaxID=2999072 RepID=A0ABT4DGG8_9CLOT|nr:methyl-accepting chemotaxis protein [Clostridium brassicae]MCY6960211.1 methyl-accepting chemotaxis protein [Clostridium brassicae]